MHLALSDTYKHETGYTQLTLLLPLFQFTEIITQAQRKYIHADRARAEKLATNVEKLFHYPAVPYMIEDPESCMAYLLTKGAKHHVPIVFLNIIWDMLCDFFEAIHVERPRGFQTMRQNLLDQLPNCTMHYTVMHKRTRAVFRVSGKRFKKKRFPACRYRCLITETRSDLKQLLDYHASLHTGSRGRDLKQAMIDEIEIPIHLYVDGVAPSSTGSSKMICQVIRHQCCNLILSFNTIVYSPDYKIDAPELMQGLLHQLHKYPNVRVKLVLADMPERLRLLGLSNFNAEYGCQICFSPGEKREGAPGMNWPYWTTAGDPRDLECFQAMPDEARRKNGPVGGHKQRSSLLDIQGFNVVDSVPIDPMHLFAGLSRYLWEQFPKKFLTKAQAKKLTEEISAIYTDLQLPLEAKRKPRPIDPVHFRANEWKQLVALCGIDISEAWLDLGFRQVAVAWQRYTFVLRMMAQGDVWYKTGSMNGRLVKAQIQLLYQEIEELLGKNGCVPNLHALHHLPEWRARMPLSVMSTEKAEAFYGTVRKSFAEQSASIGKQVNRVSSEYCT